MVARIVRNEEGFLVAVGSSEVTDEDVRLLVADRLESVREYLDPADEPELAPRLVDGD